MKVIITGTGTSQGVPVISCDCRVCQSPDLKDKRLRTAASFFSGDSHVAIDAGPDFRSQMLNLGANRLDALMMTHYHNDHIAGLDDIRPFNFRQNEAIRVYADSICSTVLEKKYDYIFAKKPYPGAPRIHLTNHQFQPFHLDQLKITPLPIMHGKLPISGYRINDVAYITDANEIKESVYDELKNLKVLILNALRWEKHHSHFTLGEAIDVAQRVGAQKTYFTHISHYLGRHSEVEEDLPKGCYLAYDGLEIEVE